MSQQQDYPVVRSQPLAKFYYQGQSHTHPVRRTVVLIENNDNYFVGYELREGSKVRTFQEAPVKTYTKQKIANLRQVDQRRKFVAKARRQGVALEQTSTLWRGDLTDIAKAGI